LFGECFVFDGLDDLEALAGGLVGFGVEDVVDVEGHGGAPNGRVRVMGQGLGSWHQGLGSGYQGVGVVGEEWGEVGDGEGRRFSVKRLIHDSKDLPCAVSLPVKAMRVMSA